jgi:hypothetical protein
LVPLGSFILPVYKIKNLPKLSFRDRILANIISGVLIYLFSKNLFLVYIVVYLLLEGFYYAFERTNIKIFDRIFLSTILITGLVYFMITIFVGAPSDVVSVMEKAYLEYVDIEPEILAATMRIIKDNFLFAIFAQLLVINYFTYFILKGKSYRKWGISYQWVMIYIATFFLDRIFEMGNFYVKNLYIISALIYIIYGVKVIYTIFREKIKWRGYVKGLAVVTAILFPIATFILGVIISFDIIKIERIKE